jgi:hypothetical protein
MRTADQHTNKQTNKQNRDMSTKIYVSDANNERKYQVSTDVLCDKMPTMQ